MKTENRMTLSLEALAAEARECRACEHELALGPRPIFAVHPRARVLIASQAPGRIAHDSGVPFEDPSGRRLRRWMGLDRDTFYKPESVAILPMGFCYPGKGSGGDSPPLERCAAKWRRAFLAHMPRVRLVLLIGGHAQAWHLDDWPGSVRETIAARASLPKHVFPLPHPSPRNNGWLRDNAWFETTVLAELRARVAAALA